MLRVNAFYGLGAAKLIVETPTASVLTGISRKLTMPKDKLIGSGCIVLRLPKKAGDERALNPPRAWISRPIYHSVGRVFQPITQQARHHAYQ
jgi:hypothetical protein